MVGHLKDAADVGWLAFVQEEVRAGSLEVQAVAALEEFQGNKSIKKISRRSRMESEPSPQCFEILRVFGQLCEDLHLYGTQQCF